MSFLSILETVFIGPLKLVFEIIFNMAHRATNHPGLAIIFLSLIMNILVLPLYKRADAMQEQSRDVEARLQKGVRHIKKTFSGDERMMILQTYYRQNHYKPTNALKGSVSLLLEIPFFMAAYQFLSHLGILDGVSFGPIADLGAPDGLLTIGSISINLLPVLMTAVNILSSALYLKGSPLKTKIQLYAMALFFLVFLYASPACLVFYWTLNNVFSLVKNIFYKLKNPKKVLCWLCAVCGVASIGFAIVRFGSITNRVFALLLVAGFCLILPLVYTLIKKYLPARRVTATAEPDKKTFLLGSIFLTLLIGVLIPSTYLAASPQEYVDLNHFFHPVWYLVSSAAMAAGFFLVWLRVFYWLANDTGKAVFDKLVWILCGICFVDYMFFGRDLGNLTAELQYNGFLNYSTRETLINLCTAPALAVVLWLLSKKWKKLPGTVLLIASLALGCMSGVNTVTIFRSVAQIQLLPEDSKTTQDCQITLSKDGQNVVVIMLDRAMGAYVPFLMQEKPELMESFSGFTYYSNVVSYGPTTNFGVPALVGGYEYTPVELNKRAEETLEEKHNEALKVMPRLFSENGYQVTLFNPPYAGYQWVPDLTVFDDLENTTALIAEGYNAEAEQVFQKDLIEKNLRNFFCFGVMKCMPIVTQGVLYDSGTYLRIENITVPEDGQFVYTSQVSNKDITATGVTKLFMRPYLFLDAMPEITRISEESKGNFLFMCNDTTHEPMLLQLPSYTPAQEVDNSAYLHLYEDRELDDGRTLRLDTSAARMHYHANMAAFLQLAQWLDHLKALDVYDNTRIILVSDHGRKLEQVDQLMMETPRGDIDIGTYYPLLMVKDYNATGYTTDDTFMTNADVPTLATSGVIENPVNPYTGKPIHSGEKTAHRQYICLSDQWDININDGNRYIASHWASVEADMWDPDDWHFYNKSLVLDTHQFPEN